MRKYKKIESLEEQIKVIERNALKLLQMAASYKPRYTYEEECYIINHNIPTKVFIEDIILYTDDESINASYILKDTGGDIIKTELESLYPDAYYGRCMKEKIPKHFEENKVFKIIE